MQVAIIIIAVVLALLVISFLIQHYVRKHQKAKEDEANGIVKQKVSAKQWILNHLPTKRRLIQVYAAMLYNANIKGYISGHIYQSATTKYVCVPGLNCYSCPGAVGACPLGALQNSLAASKTRAPYYVLGILALFALSCARTICGFLCPVGLVQEWLYKIRTPKVRKSRITRILSYFKYVLLALTIAIPLIYALRDVPLPAFCKYICPAGTLGGAVMLLINPSNEGMFAQLGWQFTWKFGLLVAFATASVFIFRVFCRFVCPLGAIYGFFNKLAFLGVTVDRDDCTDCGLCVSHCKMDIRHVGDHECINCGECIPVCPTGAIRWKGSRIFLHKNAVDEQETVKPISFAADSTLQPVTVAAGASADSVAVAQEVATATGSVTVSQPPESAMSPRENVQEAVRSQTTEVAPTAKKKKRGTKFWVELTAWIAALVVLAGALVYYNFIDLENDVVTGYDVGETAPDFSVRLCGNDEKFTLYKNRGKVTVVTFWDVENAESVAQIPYFAEFADNHQDITVLAVHFVSDSDVLNFIYEKEWLDSNVVFAWDNADNEVFAKFGGESLAAKTVIADAQGKVCYNSDKTFDNSETLRKALTKALDTVIGFAVGDTAPDFTLPLKGLHEGETYTLYGNRGKIMLINFWGTWCTPCVHEMPFIAEFAANHPEVAVLAIHSDNLDKPINEFLSTNGWNNYNITFAWDVNGTTYTKLGGTGAWPTTIILDEDGVVLYNSIKSFDSAQHLEEVFAHLMEERE